MNDFHLTAEDRLRLAKRARGRSYRITDFVEAALYLFAFALTVYGMTIALPF